ncbi:hypothetical protein CN97_00910 [Haematobacter massiliensis]|uniref:Uncharacterized protein n=1 Tax=Haematobacter massiliensis TaxID=195105 RepID=A0A086Y0J8_9RHOB|nr:hypothetical protein [Haematobacter massiliensis]KFI27798.1 hypothetical protein CN97_00910 [Haematobacter massiliensis]OWJ82741.1 hypothetical protein CDV51_17185 [Haematobacter massiliensis]
MKLDHPWRDHYMEDAFLGFVSYASKELVAAFEADEGPLMLGLTPIDAMIDKATGQDQREAQRFMDWCVKQFGTPEQVCA